MVWKYIKSPKEEKTEFPALPHDFRALRREDPERFISQAPADTLRRVHIGAALAAEFLVAEGLRVPPFCLSASGYEEICSVLMKFEQF